MRSDLHFDYDYLAAFCRKWQIAELSLFGSALRDDFRADSDLDFLITFAPGAPWDLFHWIAMRDELAVHFGRKVDLVAKDAIRNPWRRQEILRTREILYAA